MIGAEGISYPLMNAIPEMAELLKEPYCRIHLNQ